MAREHIIKKGLDLPINGEPQQEIHPGQDMVRVGIINDDYHFMKPRMHVAVGDVVKRGQLLFEDRKAKGVCFTAPAAGTVSAVNRGAKRKFESIVIELSESEKSGKVNSDEEITFEKFSAEQLKDIGGEKVRDILGKSGLWTALRARPFSRIPSIDEECHSIFITATDTNPLAPSIDVILKGSEDAFTAGLNVLSNLTEGTLWLCKGRGSKVVAGGASRVKEEVFVGKHPAGLVGTHIHLLDPVGPKKIVWYINLQDVIEVGTLFTTGHLDPQRVISLAGPVVKEPRLLRTRRGADLDALTKGLLKEGENRVISGSVLTGRKAQGDVHGYLGRYQQQVSCIAENREREFLGWLQPGGSTFSTVRTFLNGFLGGKKLDFTTTTNGSHRAMVPIGMFERVMPLDILPTFLLRSLVAKDIERAEHLGCLELDEEDLGLCSFVSPGKEDFGRHLRENLTHIWKEG